MNKKTTPIQRQPDRSDMNRTIQHIKKVSITGLAVMLLLITARPLEVNAFQLEPIASNDLDTPNQIEVLKTGDAEALMVTLNVKNMELVDVLKRLTREAGVGLSYDADTVLDKGLTNNAKDEPFFSQLDELLDDTKVGYTLSEDGRVLVLKEKVIESDIETDDQIIMGRVVDSRTGEPLPGVNILLLGTSIGTSSDADGRFELQVPELSGSIILTFIGYERMELPIDGRSDLEIELVPGFISGDELVVIGYGVQRQRDLSTAATRISSEKFNEGASLSPQQLIQGRVAGVNVLQNSGKPGGSSTVSIRGGTSATGSNEPLYVIDGMPISTTSTRRQNNIGSLFDTEPVNPLNSINPNDIESISVLKDASATSIYGSRGANGVIIITTKTGRSGSVQTDYESTFGFSRVAKTLEFLDADQYRQTNNDLGLTFLDQGMDINWQDQIFRTAYSQNHDLSFSGGTENTRYRASVRYGNQEGIILSSANQNISTRMNAFHSVLNGRLTFDLRLSGTKINATNAPLSNNVGGETGTNILWGAYGYNPTLPIKNDDGDFFHVSQFNVNPVSYSEELEDETLTTRVITNLSSTFRIVNPLSVNLNYAYTFQDIERNAYISRASPLGGGFGGRAITQEVSDTNLLAEVTLNYRQSFWGNHQLDVIGGYSHQYFTDEGYRITASGFITDEFKWNSVQAASNFDNVSTFKESNTLISLYSRANYDYDNRYIITATLRRDGSSRFGSGNEWGIFPSASFAWRISSEPFFPEVEFINDLKFRVSYGITGNQEIGNLNSLTTLGAANSGYVMGGVRRTVVLPEQFANPDLKWEETKQFNLGVDFELFNGRIFGKADYYNKLTEDLLLNFSVPSPSVVNTQLANVGSIANKGLEIELSGQLIRQETFVWNLDLNFSANRNEIQSLSNNQWSTDEIIYSSPRGVGIATGTVAQYIRPGYALGTFWGKRFLGVENGQEVFSVEEEIIGNAQPDFTFGIGNTILYRNWDLNFNLRASVGNDVLNNTAIHFSYLSNLPSRNVFPDAIDSGVEFGASKQYSDRWIEDGSFLKLDNVTIGYTFDVNQTGMFRNARIYATAQNLFVLTGYSGLDPEVNSDITGSGRPPLGIDYLSYPRARTLTLGVRIGL